MPFFWLVVGILAVWRVTHLLFAESGPAGLMADLRRRFASPSGAGVFDCFYCLSLWVALPVALLAGDGWLARLLLWPALSAGAIAVEHVLHPERPEPAALVLEDKEDN
jgi:hypothetical protein